MRALLFLIPGSLGVVAAGTLTAQEVPADARERDAAEKAARAMEAMDRLETGLAAASGAGSQEPGTAAPKKPKDKKKAGSPDTPSAGEGSRAPENEDGEAGGQDDPEVPPQGKSGTGAVPLLPVPSPDGRGVDVTARSRLDNMLPVGRSHQSVYYPMYRPLDYSRGNAPAQPLTAPGEPAGMTAPLESLFESDLVTRLDNDHVQFDRARWVQFEEPPATGGAARPSMTLEIEKGVYDLKNEILMTNQPVRIENQQFVIEGDSMLHDRASGLTRITGRVKMTFYNQADGEAGSPPATAGTPGTAAETNQNTPGKTASAGGPQPVSAPPSRD